MSKIDIKTILTSNTSEQGQMEFWIRDNEVWIKTMFANAPAKTAVFPINEIMKVFYLIEAVSKGKSL